MQKSSVIVSIANARGLAVASAIAASVLAFGQAPTLNKFVDEAGSLSSMKEYRLHDTYTFNGSWYEGTSGRHVVELKTYFPDPTLSGSIHTTYGGRPADMELREGWAYTVAVKESGAGLGRMDNDHGSYGFGSIEISQSTSQNCPYVTFGAEANGYVPLQLQGTGSIAGTTITVPVRLAVTIRYNYTDTQGGYSDVPYTYHRTYAIAFNKISCGDASIDTRRMFGDPHSEDGTPGNDPNAELRNVHFGDWTYRGGLFIGWKAHDASNDQSGLARIQLYPSSSPSDTSLIAGCLSMYDLLNSGRTIQRIDMDLGLYAISGGESTDESTALWSNRWPVKTFDGLTSNLDYLQHVSLDDTRTVPTDFRCWQLKDSTGHIPSAGLSHLVVALAGADEPNPDDLFSGGGTVTEHWRYFASKDYQAEDTSNFPRNDSAPRLWAGYRGSILYEW